MNDNQSINQWINLLSGCMNRIQVKTNKMCSQLYPCILLIDLSMWFHIHCPTRSQHLVPTDSESAVGRCPPKFRNLVGGKKFFGFPKNLDQVSATGQASTTKYLTLFSLVACNRLANIHIWYLNKRQQKSLQQCRFPKEMQNVPFMLLINFSSIQGGSVFHLMYILATASGCWRFDMTTALPQT